MKIMRKSWKLVSLALIVGLLAAMIPVGTVMAATLGSVGDSINPTTISTEAVHTVTFTTKKDIPVGGKIEITFPSAFTGIDSNIVDGDVAETLTAGAASFAASGQVITGITDTAIVTKGAQTIVIGGTNKITNPANAGTYIVQVVTKDGSNNQLDSGYTVVSIGSGTGASVHVNSYISLTITDQSTAGINFGNVDPNTVGNPDEDQSDSNYSVRLSVGSETTKATVTLQEQITTWTGSADLTAYWNTSNTTTGQTQYTTGSSGNIATGFAKGNDKDLWNFLDVGNVATGDYEATITYSAS